MKERVVLPVRMTLLSDAVFGSGMSIPGGEDIAVCLDEKGYPYLRGSTWKGLLRESLENLLVWTGGDPAAASALLGDPGWAGTSDDRRLHFTALKLAEPPAEAAGCCALRTFTSLEDGVTRTGTLRTASCICAGLSFDGELVCAEEDVVLLREALAGIKWAGTMRSRGFGRVRFEAGEAKRRPGASSAAGTCIRYRLRTAAPVLITDLSGSWGNTYETRGYIPGSAVRGAVISALASRRPEWFAANKASLLADTTRFLDAVPIQGTLPPLPAIKGFYENKEETVFESVVPNGSFTPGLKRAKLGRFCALDGDTVRYWSASTDSGMRIRRGSAEEDSRPFQTRYLCAGQELEGYILADEPGLMEELSRGLGSDIWIGADRYEGFGKCEVLQMEAMEQPAWLSQYGYQPGDTTDDVLYLLAVSPLTMLDERGRPCGLEEAQLAARLGVEQVEITQCSTSLVELGGYNRTWECRAPAVRMYDRGSIFRLRCDRAPGAEAVRQVELEGLGIRRSEGCGQVLFIRRALFEALRQKEKAEAARGERISTGAQLRRRRCLWAIKAAEEVAGLQISRSQLGTIQALCEQARQNASKEDELKIHLKKNLEGRKAKHGSRYEGIAALVDSVLNNPVGETLGIDHPDSRAERLGLLCQLFDYSRKNPGGER